MNLENRYSLYNHHAQRNLSGIIWNFNLDRDEYTLHIVHTVFRSGSESEEYDQESENVYLSNGSKISWTRAFITNTKVAIIGMPGLIPVWRGLPFLPNMFNIVKNHMQLC